MSKRLDERSKQLDELKAYYKSRRLCEAIIRFAKHKDNEEKQDGRHIPKRFSGIAHMLTDAAVETSTRILIANEIYVGKELTQEDRIDAINKRVTNIKMAIMETYKIENLIRILDDSWTIAESTFNNLVCLTIETRNLLASWAQHASGSVSL